MPASCVSAGHGAAGRAARPGSRSGTSRDRPERAVEGHEPPRVGAALAGEQPEGLGAHERAGEAGQRPEHARPGRRWAPSPRRAAPRRGSGGSRSCRA